MGLFRKKSVQTVGEHRSGEKTFAELMKDYDKAMLNGTPQEEAAILDRAATVAESDIERFELSTKITGFKQRYS